MFFSEYAKEMQFAGSKESIRKRYSTNLIIHCRVELIKMFDLNVYTLKCTPLKGKPCICGYWKLKNL